MLTRSARASVNALQQPHGPRRGVGDDRDVRGPLDARLLAEVQAAEQHRDDGERRRERGPQARRARARARVRSPSAVSIPLHADSGGSTGRTAAASGAKRRSQVVTARRATSENDSTRAKRARGRAGSVPSTYSRASESSSCGSSYLMARGTL